MFFSRRKISTHHDAISANYAALLASLCQNQGGTIWPMPDAHSISNHTPLCGHYIHPQDVIWLKQWLQESCTSPTPLLCKRLLRICQHPAKQPWQACQLISMPADNTRNFPVLMLFPQRAPSPLPNHENNQWIWQCWLHTIRNHLTTISGYAEWLMTGRPAYKKAESICAIHQSAATLLAQCNQTLTDTPTTIAGDEEWPSLNQFLQHVKQQTSSISHDSIRINNRAIYLHRSFFTQTNSIAKLANHIAADMLVWEQHHNQLIISAYGHEIAHLSLIADWLSSNDNLARITDCPLKTHDLLMSIYHLSQLSITIEAHPHAPDGGFLRLTFPVGATILLEKSSTTQLNHLPQDASAGNIPALYYLH